MNLYDIKIKHAEEEKFSTLEKYRENVLLIVNVASQCGFTPQYDGLEKLYQKYKEEGLVILGFPCNQFANQEPGDDQEILDFCTLNYGVSFPIFSKIDVNGENEHPLYGYLKSKTHSIFGNAIKWNFTKFLVSRNGDEILRFAPIRKPSGIEDKIIKFLKI